MVTKDCELPVLFHYLNKDFNYNGIIGDNAIAPTGERYITLTSTGIKHEGERISGMFISPEIASIYFKNEFYKYAFGKSNIYWRRIPTLKVIEMKEFDYSRSIEVPVNFYTVVCRVLISNKGVI